MKHLIVGLAALALLFGGAGQVMAGPISAGALTVVDWANPGDGLIMNDSITGLNWLNLTVTSGISYTQALADISSGQYPGFRVASAAELSQLFGDAGLSAPYHGTPSASIYNQAYTLLQDWGTLYSYQGFSFSDISTSTFVSDGTVNYASVGLYPTDSPPMAFALLEPSYSGNPESIGPFGGVALVEGTSLVPTPPWPPADGIATTPEPASFIMLAIGIASLAGYKWRRQK